MTKHLWCFNIGPVAISEIIKSAKIWSISVLFSVSSSPWENWWNLLSQLWWLYTFSHGLLDTKTIKHLSTKSQTSQKTHKTHPLTWSIDRGLTLQPIVRSVIAALVVVVVLVHHIIHHIIHHRFDHGGRHVPLPHGDHAPWPLERCMWWVAGVASRSSRTCSAWWHCVGVWCSRWCAHCNVMEAGRRGGYECRNVAKNWTRSTLCGVHTLCLLNAEDDGWFRLLFHSLLRFMSGFYSGTHKKTQQFEANNAIAMSWNR